VEDDEDLIGRAMSTDLKRQAFGDRGATTEARTRADQARAK
jgi:hypothetical protein